MVTLVVVLITLALMLFINALYVAAEFSTVKARQHRTHIAQLADANDRLAKQLIPILTDQRKLDDYVAACQLGITASSLVLGAYGQNTVAAILAPLLIRFGGLAETVAFSISATAILLTFTILQMVLAELMPKSLAVQFPERVALLTVVPVKWSRLVLQPFIKIFNGSGDAILKLMRIEYADGHSEYHSLDEIERMISQTHQGGLIDDKEQQMLRNAFRMRELTARQVMVPRTRMLTAPVDCTVQEVLATSFEGGYSRIPIYENTIDNIIGFVHVKDLFRKHLHGQEGDLRSILRQVIYVPDTMPITSVWDTLNEKRQYLVIVFDEYGGTEGLITFEDVIEEIFGELQDEFDEHEMALISYDKDGRTHLRGDLLITDINEYLNLDLPYEEADTLGGLVFSLLGRPPREGDEITINDLVIKVESISESGVSEFSFNTPISGPFRVGEWEITSRE